MMSLPATVLGRRFCVSRKGGRGGGEWVHKQHGCVCMGSALERHCFAMGGPFFSYAWKHFRMEGFHSLGGQLLGESADYCSLHRIAARR